MAQNFDDPIYSRKASSFVSMRIQFVRGDGLTKTYRLFKEWQRSYKNNRKHLQGQYATPVAWTEGQQDGPVEGSFVLGCASWEDCLDTFFLGTPLGSTYDVFILKQENGISRIDEYRGVNNSECKLVGGSEGGEALMEEVSWGALEYRPNGMRQYDPNQWTFSLDVQFEAALSLSFSVGG